MKNKRLSNLVFLLFFNILFSVSLYSQHPGEALIDSLKKVLLNAKEDTSKFNLLSSIAIKYRFLNLDSAKFYAQEEFELANRLNFPKGQLKGLHHLSASYLKMGDYKQCLAYAIEMGTLAKEVQDTLSLMYSYNVMAGAYANLNEFPKAIEYYTKQNDIAEALGDKVDLGIGYLNLGKLLARLESKKEKALEYTKKAIVLFEEIDYKPPLAFAYQTVSNLLLDLKDNKQAFEYNEKALKINLELGMMTQLINNYRTSGQIYLEEEKYDLAIRDFEKALEYAQNLKANEKACGVFLNLAISYNKIKQFDKSLAILLEAEPLVMESESILFREPFHTFMAEALQGSGNYQAVFEHMQQAISWKDSASVLTKLEEFEDIQTKYETEKKEQNNEFLTQQNSLLASKNQLYTYIAIGLVFIIAILAFVFYQLRKQKKIIEHQNQKLEELNATKDRLFAIIAHDMRNAVHSFRDVTDSIRFFIKRKQPERIDKIAGVVEKSIDQLGRLLDNLLEWALVQRGDMPYQPELLDLTNAIDNILGNFEGIAERKEVFLEMNISTGAQIFVDKNAMETIVRNLLSNALKFTHTGGKVSIRAVAEKENTLIEIQDTGIGMSPKQMATLFQPSQNKSTDGTDGEKGSGLGLILVKELVELNKGNIRVDTKEGEGTKFVLSIPKAA